MTNAKKRRSKGLVIPIAIVKRYQRVIDASHTNELMTSSELDMAYRAVERAGARLAEDVLKVYRKRMKLPRRRFW